MLQWFRSLFGKHELEPCVGFGALNEADRCGRCDRGLPFRDGEGCRRCRHCNFSEDATLQGGGTPAAGASFEAISSSATLSSLVFSFAGASFEAFTARSTVAGATPITSATAAYTLRIKLVP
jgi:hypothetical protein